MKHVCLVEDEARVLGIVIVNWKKFEQRSRGKSCCLEKLVDGFGVTKTMAFSGTGLPFPVIIIRMERIVFSKHRRLSTIVASCRVSLADTCASFLNRD